MKMCTNVNFQVDWNLALRRYCCIQTVHTREVSEVFLALPGYILARSSNSH